MRYLFHSKAEQEGELFEIMIPFNVWEISVNHESIEADILLENKVINCVLHHMQKGNYKIQLSSDEVAHINIGQEYEILLHISGNLIVAKKVSAYTKENPIRKIDGLTLINQKVDGLCGQTCVAMLAGITIDEVMADMELREWQATMGRIISALDYYGIEHSEMVVYTEGRPATLPKCCVMMEKMGFFCHYLLHYNGEFYDPNLKVFTEYDLSKLQGYLEVKCE